MKNILYIALLIITSNTILAQKKVKIKGNKEVITTIHSLEKEFNTIKVDDELEVNLRQGEKNNYVLTTDRNLQEVITFTVQDSTLAISTTHRIARSKKLEISLEFVKIKRIILKNDAEIKGEGSFKAKEIHIDAHDSSKFLLDIDAEKVFVSMNQKSDGKIKIKSNENVITMADNSDLEATLISNKANIKLINSADLSLFGDTEKTDIILKESSKIDADKIKTSSVNLYASDKTDASIYASKDLTLYAEGKTNVYLYGEPEIEIKGFKEKAKLQKK